MRKYFLLGLIMALNPEVLFGVTVHYQSPSVRIEQLLAEKQAKMKKLESCKGTTKNLKIAGLSTLGITAVGVAGNIAEAVVLDKYKGKVSAAETERDKALAENQQYRDARDKELAEQRKKEEADRKAKLAELERTNHVCQQYEKSVANMKAAIKATNDKAYDNECRPLNATFSENVCRAERDATLICTATIRENDKNVEHTYTHIFPMKTEFVDMGVVADGYDDALVRILDKNNKIDKQNCSVVNVTTIECYENEFAKYQYRFTEIKVPQAEQKPESKQIDEFKELGSVSETNNIAKARHLIAWYARQNVDTDLNANSCSIKTVTTGVWNYGKDIVSCNDDLYLFSFHNLKRTESGSKEDLTRYFCQKFVGSDAMVSGGKCPDDDEYVQSCVKYVIEGTGSCKTTDEILQDKAKKQAKAAEDERANAQVNAEIENRNKQVYCDKIGCTTNCSVIDNSNNQAKEKLKAVYCGSNTSTMKCFNQDTSNLIEYNCTTGKPVSENQDNPAPAEEISDEDEKELVKIIDTASCQSSCKNKGLEYHLYSPYNNGGCFCKKTEQFAESFSKAEEVVKSYADAQGISFAKECSKQTNKLVCLTNDNVYYTFVFE